VAEQGLFVVRDGKEKKLASDGCAVRTLDGFVAGALAYFSPCEERHLVVVTETGKTFKYEQPVDIYNAQAGKLYFTTTTDTTTSLSMVLGKAPERVITLVELPKFQIQNVAMARAGHMLVQIRRENSSALWDVDVDGKEHAVTVISEELLELHIVSGGMAMLQSDGEFTLRGSDGVQVLLRAQGVTRSSFRFVFSGKSSALAYISQVDAELGLGRLELHFLTGAHFEIADSVREFREVWWPERGILYATGGEHPSLSFARVDVPCETTSDTAWACGF
jgi:hypothetical protein